jgi:hypothetical protein
MRKRRRGDTPKRVKTCFHSAPRSRTGPASRRVIAARNKPLAFTGICMVSSRLRRITPAFEFAFHPGAVVTQGPSTGALAESALARVPAFGSAHVANFRRLSRSGPGKSCDPRRGPCGLAALSVWQGFGSRVQRDESVLPFCPGDHARPVVAQTTGSCPAGRSRASLQPSYGGGVRTVDSPVHPLSRKASSARDGRSRGNRVSDVARSQKERQCVHAEPGAQRALVSLP